MAEYTTVVQEMKRGGFPAVGAKIGVIDLEIDLTDINSGTLADADIIQAFTLPIGTLVLAAGMEVTELVVGAAQVVLDLGDGTTSNQFVDGSDAGSPFDIGTSGSQLAVGTYSQPADAVTSTIVGNALVVGAEDTLDITVQAITGASATLTAGKVRVWAVVADIDALNG